jgi:hypothetical protein
MAAQSAKAGDSEVLQEGEKVPVDLNRSLFRSSRAVHRFGWPPDVKLWLPHLPPVGLER